MPFTDPWTEAEPTDNTYLREVDDYIRRNARAIRERLSIEHYAYVDETGMANVGKHKPGSAKILAGVAGGRPSPDADAPGTLYHETDSHRIVRDTGSSWVVLEHADSHAADGDDPITPESIGAETPQGATEKANAVATSLTEHEDATSVHGATSDATANRMVLRDANGRAKFGVPADPADAARKAEVDQLTSDLGTIGTDLSSHKDASSAHNATSTPTPNRMAMRDAQGACQFAGLEVTAAGGGLILRTPDGQRRWLLTVNNSGDLVTTEVV